MSESPSVATFRKFFSVRDPGGDKAFADKIREKGVQLRPDAQPEEDLPWAELTPEERAEVTVLKVPRRFKDVEAAGALPPEQAVALMRALHAAELLDVVDVGKTRGLIPVEVRRAVADAKGQHLVRRKLRANVYRPSLDGEEAAGPAFDVVESLPDPHAPKPPPAAAPTEGRPPEPETKPKPAPASPAPGSPPARAPAASPPASPPAGGGDELDKLKAEVEQLHKSLNRVDHFTLLGVSRDAPEADIKARYREMAKRFHPDKLAGLPAERADAIRPMLGEVFSALGEAQRTLVDAKTRAEYVQDLDRRTAASTTGGAQRVKPRRAEEAKSCGVRGRVYMNKREYGQAEVEFLKASELDPDLPEYRTDYAWALSLNPSRPEADRRKKALDVLAHVTQSARHADAFYKMGLLHRTLGEHQKAEAAFRQACAVDKRHAEAAREVRVMDMRADKARAEEGGQQPKPVSGIFDTLLKKK
jgi:hypothetical protein